MAGWNISADQVAEEQIVAGENKLGGNQEGSAQFSWKLLGQRQQAGSRSASRREAVAPMVELLADFELVQSAADCGSTRTHVPPKDGRSSARRARAEAGHRGGRGRRGPHFQSGALRPGDEVAGFRIVLELGRGAFAHVYLAEEVNLGRRPVAIKVSRPDGDEPQILARLQHTHIVPVHSVCDDPVTGLRVLCMPYFGGANLAQVLETAGGLDATGHDGRSLVKALDEISRSLPTCSNRPAGSFSARRSRRSRPAHTELSGARGLSTSKRVHVPAASRFRSLLSRLVGPSAALEAVSEQPDCAQPSRQFLSGASAIQAAVWIAARLADGLEHAHSRGLLHRDLKPSNILLAGDGTPMLLDFNLSVEQPTELPGGKIRRALVGGTLPYMSPEHLDAFSARGATSPESVDERSDIYAMGLILFEMLAGRHPFQEPPPGIPMLECIEQMIAARQNAPSLRASAPDVPWTLDALVGKCLSFDPAGRYARAGDLAEDLRRFLDYLPMKHCPEPSIRERMGKWARRHPGLCGSTSIALMSIVLVGMLGGAVALGYDKTQDLVARVRLHAFDRKFTEMQFLLNTTGNSPERTARGIEISGRMLAELGAESERPARLAAWRRRLTSGEQQRLREQVTELIMLEARARVALASKRGSEADRRRAIERAIGCLDRAARIDRAAPSALYLERARYHAALGESDLAAGDRELAAARKPSTCHDLTLLGTTLIAAGDPAGAEPALRRAVHLDGTSPWAWFVLGHCYFAQGRYLEAAGAFAACTARGPTFAWAHFNRGLALAKAGRLLDAQDAYDRALALEPTFYEALVDRAMVELELDRLGDAERDLLRAIELGSNDPVVLATLGTTWARLGRRSEAERYFGAWIARSPHELVVRVARGMTRIQTDPEGARVDFANVLDQEADHAYANYGMALLKRRTDLRAALAHLDRSLTSNSHLIDALQVRALVRARLGERAALDDVDRLVECATAHRLYNGACAVAILAEKANDPRLVSHALELLDRAIRAGFPPAEARDDPDLKSLHSSPRFNKLVAGG
jgi:serine/threonine protein kinase/tetratricopeptide (TPR) repeat protein